MGGSDSSPGSLVMSRSIDIRNSPSDRSGTSVSDNHSSLRFM